MLEELAAVHDTLARVKPERVHGDPRTPHEIAEGTPLLRSRALGRDVFEEAARLVLSMAEALLHTRLPAPLAQQCRAVLNSDLLKLVRTAPSGDIPPGVPAFLAWKALGRVVRPNLDGWHRSDCPTCGALPAMAQLRETENGRERLLVCGLCETRWGFARIGCPFCGNVDASKLGVLEAEGEKYRIDVCRACDAYLKTYVGAREEKDALSDWTTLHLDAACEECGLHRGGPSLYAI